MPTTKTITLYQFDELPTDKAKEKAREWLRECEAQDFDPCYENYDAAAKLLGITIADTGRKQYGVIPVPDIRYSGFFSQGDGASFVGTYEFEPGCAEAIRKEWPKDEKLHAIADDLCALYVARRLAGKSDIKAKIEQRGNYVHKNTMSLEWSVSGDNEDEEISADEEAALLEAMRDFAQWIYDGLESEYEWRLSDEQIDETLQANEYTFTEDGERED